MKIPVTIGDWWGDIDGEYADEASQIWCPEQQNYHLQLALYKEN